MTRGRWLGGGCFAGQRPYSASPQPDSQTAMLTAKAARLNGNKLLPTQTGGELNILPQRLSNANVILDHAPDLADQVIASKRLTVVLPQPACCPTQAGSRPSGRRRFFSRLVKQVIRDAGHLCSLSMECSFKPCDALLRCALWYLASGQVARPLARAGVVACGAARWRAEHCRPCIVTSHVVHFSHVANYCQGCFCGAAVVQLMCRRGRVCGLRPTAH